MKLFDELNDDNFILFASRYYENPQCSSLDEFHEDLSRFRYVKRLVNKYIKGEELRERLILNHIIIIFNSFGVGPSKKMIWHKFKTPQERAIIKPFLVYMNYMKSDEMISVSLDTHVVQRLRSLQ